ncbi:hypothetical protein [Saliphagus infecundisoli]|uniref:DUF2971 domain-containing protein n=1 Tax=Saliphagus infecundisoli TaxID=1849069 RepID=A0ABD5QAB7_9EURY|nr:hypothetical protein [Saliphagus infecundisoli]
MPHIQENFPEPDEDNPELWRYMSLAKFLSILHEDALYFPRLADLPDKFEGTLSEPTAEALRNEVRRCSGNDFPDALITLPEAVRQTSYVNCWHRNSGESMAMWNQYSKHPIAIKSTYTRLSESLGSVIEEKREARYPILNDPSETPIRISPVNYADYSTDPMERIEDVSQVTLYKRQPFRYENEIRAVILGESLELIDVDKSPSPTLHIGFEDDPDDLDNGENSQVRTPLTKSAIEDLNLRVEKGLYVAIDVETLIESVVLKPDTPMFVFEAVQAVVREMGFSEDMVRRSSIERDPVTTDYPET